MKTVVTIPNVKLSQNPFTEMEVLDTLCPVGLRRFISLKGKLWKDSSSPNTDVDFVAVVY